MFGFSLTKILKDSVQFGKKLVRSITTGNPVFVAQWERMKTNPDLLSESRMGSLKILLEKPGYFSLFFKDAFFATLNEKPLPELELQSLFDYESKPGSLIFPKFSPWRPILNKGIKLSKKAAFLLIPFSDSN